MYHLVLMGLLLGVVAFSTCSAKKKKRVDTCKQTPIPTENALPLTQESSTEDRKVIVRGVAQVRRDKHTLRFPFRDEHSLTSTLQSVIDTVSQRLSYGEICNFRGDAPPTLAVNFSPILRDDMKAIPYSTLLLSDVILDPSIDFFLTLDYDPKYLYNFVHSLSFAIYLIPEASTVKEVMGALIEFIDDLLPNAHGINDCLQEDLDRLLSVLGQDLSPFLSTLIPKLLRIVHSGAEGYDCCQPGDTEQKHIAQSLLTHCFNNFSDQMAHYSDLIVQSIVHYRDQVAIRWALEGMRSWLLTQHLGDTKAASALRVQYWNSIRRSMIGDRRKWWTTIWLRGVCKLMEGSISKGLNTKDLQGIASIIRSELEQIEERRECRALMNVPVDQWTEDWVLKGICELIRHSLEIAGDRFNEFLPPLIPLLYVVGDNSKEKEAVLAILERITKFAPEFPYDIRRCSMADKSAFVSGEVESDDECVDIDDILFRKK